MSKETTTNGEEISRFKPCPYRCNFTNGCKECRIDFVNPPVQIDCEEEGISKEDKDRFYKIVLSSKLL